MFEFFLLLFLFPLYYSEELIPVSDLQMVNLFFQNGYCNFTLRYNNIKSSNFPQKTLWIKTIGLKSSQYLYVYDDYNKLKNDKDKFSYNYYIFRGYPYYNNEYFFEIDLTKYKADTYYITFDSSSHSSYYRDSNNFKVSVYSTIKLENSKINQTINFNDKKSNFLFYIKEYSSYYQNFGFKKLSKNVFGELQIFDLDNYELIHQISQTDYFEYNFKPTYNKRYIANLTLISTSQSMETNSIYFYFYTSSDDKIYELTYYKKPSNYTKYFFVLKNLDLILDIDDVPAYSKVYFQYDWEYSSEDLIKVYGYTEKDLIQTTEGEELYLDKDPTCVAEHRMCEDYFRKKSASVDYAILKISPLKKNEFSTYTFKIKYGYSYEYSSGLPFYSTLIGIALFIPNLIITCVNVKTNRCDDNAAAIAYFILDLLFLVGFSDVISLYLYIGGHFGFYAGIVILVLYGLISICFYSYSICHMDEKSSGWVYYIRKLGLPLASQAITQNAILSPRIKVKARAFHKESRQICKKYKKVDIYGDSEYYYEKEEYGKDLVLRERLPYLRTEEKYDDTFYSNWGRVDQGGGKFSQKYVSTDKISYEITSEEKEVETWKDEKEMKYGSWRDDTQFVSSYNASIICIEFDFKFNLYNDAENDLNNLKSEMKREGKTHDTEVEVKEDYTIPEFKKRIVCRAQDSTCSDLINLLITFIFSTIGYSSIVNFCVYYEEKDVKATIIKSISNSNISNNVNNLNIYSNKNGNNSDFDNIYAPLMTVN